MIRHWAGATAVAVATGALYTLTPLTICVAVVGAVVLRALLRDVAPDERRWIAAIVGAAIVLRIVAIGGVFVRNLPLHDDQFIGAPDGDEAYAMSRALRMRDILRGSTASGKYDYFVAYDEYGRNSYITALTVVETVFGPTPYSLRLLNVLLFVGAALLLYRVARRAFGPVPAGLGLVALLFWPTLFAWSISLLKEPLYGLLSAVVLAAAIRAFEARSVGAAAAAAATCAIAAVVARDLRPGALPLAAAGVAVGAAIFVVGRARQSFVAALAICAVGGAIVVATPTTSRFILRALESAAKTHTGHVVTVGHDYKLLDAAFYFNPATPAASALTLTRREAARYVLRAAASFIFVPAPWQLRSLRELAYLPEQMAWYALVALIPFGIVAGWQRSPLVTAMLLGYALPTAAALALTNGNVGTLLRLRGLVLPSLVWIGGLGFGALLGAAAAPRGAIVDNEGRLFGRINLFDAAVASFVVVLLPLAYGTYLLFRTPAPRIESVTSVPITREERRVAGGSFLSAKLKVRGQSLRPMLRASIGDTPALGFVFESPRSADVLVGAVPPGRHDFVLYDGVQEVARLAGAVEIRPVSAARLKILGSFVGIDEATANALAVGASYPERPDDRIEKLGPARQDRDERWNRKAEVLVRCDPDPDDQTCTVGGLSLRAPTMPTIRVAGPSGQLLRFAVSETVPEAPAVAATLAARVTTAPEIARAIHAGDRDECLDERAAVVAAIGAGRAAGDLDVTLRLGVDPSPDGWTYRGRLIKVGTRIPFTTDAYFVEATILSPPATTASSDARR